MNNVLSGAIIMGYAVAGLYFLRFWRDTRDRFFAFFAAAFWLLCAQRILLVAYSSASAESRVYLYLVRLVAFVLIVVAIVDKNRPSDRPTAGDGASR